MDERIGLGLYHSYGNRGSDGRVSVFELRWCMWGVGRGLGQSLERSCYVCLSCESGFLQIHKFSQSQACLCVFVGPGFVSTSRAFMRSSASHPTGPHGRLAQKRKIEHPLLWAGGFGTFLQHFVSAVTVSSLCCMELNLFHHNSCFFDVRDILIHLMDSIISYLDDKKNI